MDRLPGNEAAILADQEQASRGDLVDMPLAAERNTAGVRHMAAIPFGVVAPGIDAAGRDHIDADVVRGELGGEPARHADQPHLRRREMGAAAAASGNRAVAAEEQDAPVLVLDHLADQRARQVEGPVEYDIADPLPILIAHLEKRLVRPDCGVVDQDVDAAELAERFRRHRLNLVLLADIGDDRDRLDPEILRLARDRLRFLLVRARIDDDIGAFPRELQHRRAADIAPRAGDQRDLPLEPAHDRSPLADQLG